MKTSVGTSFFYVPFKASSKGTVGSYKRRCVVPSLSYLQSQKTTCSCSRYSTIRACKIPQKINKYNASSYSWRTLTRGDGNNCLPIDSFQKVGSVRQKNLGSGRVKVIVTHGTSGRLDSLSRVGDFLSRFLLSEAFIYLTNIEVNGMLMLWFESMNINIQADEWIPMIVCMQCFHNYTLTFWKPRKGAPNIVFLSRCPNIGTGAISTRQGKRDTRSYPKGPWDGGQKPPPKTTSGEVGKRSILCFTWRKEGEGRWTGNR